MSHRPMYFIVFSKADVTAIDCIQEACTENAEIPLAEGHMSQLVVYCRRTLDAFVMTAVHFANEKTQYGV